MTVDVNDGGTASLETTPWTVGGWVALRELAPGSSQAFTTLVGVRPSGVFDELLGEPQVAAFAEQFRVDVSRIDDAQRADFLAITGKHQFAVAQMVWISDVVQVRFVIRLKSPSVTVRPRLRTENAKDGGRSKGAPMPSARHVTHAHFTGIMLMHGFPRHVCPNHHRTHFRPRLRRLSQPDRRAGDRAAHALSRPQPIHRRSQDGKRSGHC